MKTIHVMATNTVNVKEAIPVMPPDPIISLVVSLSKKFISLFSLFVSAKINKWEVVNINVYKGYSKTD